MGSAGVRNLKDRVGSRVRSVSYLVCVSRVQLGHHGPIRLVKRPDIFWLGQLPRWQYMGDLRTSLPYRNTPKFNGNPTAFSFLAAFFLAGAASTQPKRMGRELATSTRHVPRREMKGCKYWLNDCILCYLHMSCPGAYVTCNRIDVERQQQYCCTSYCCVTLCCCTTTCYCTLFYS